MTTFEMVISIVYVISIVVATSVQFLFSTTIEIIISMIVVFISKEVATKQFSLLSQERMYTVDFICEPKFNILIGTCYVFPNVSSLVILIVVSLSK